VEDASTQRRYNSNNQYSDSWLSPNIVLLCWSADSIAYPYLTPSQRFPRYLLLCAGMRDYSRAHHLFKAVKEMSQNQIKIHPKANGRMNLASRFHHPRGDRKPAQHCRKRVIRNRGLAALSLP